MKTIKMLFLSSLILLPLSVLAACTSGEETNISDATDVPTDRPPDTMPDVTPDPDVTIDRPPDVTPDITPDVPDIRPDITPDITPDTTGCTHDYTTLPITTEQICYSDGTAYMYQGIYEGSSSTPPVSIFGVELWPDYGGPSAPGTYTFTDTNYATCGLCGLVGLTCTTTGCGKDILITSGSITITQLGAVGGTFAATVANVRGIEVTILSTAPYTSTPVPGGETFCADSATLNATVETPPP